MGTRAARHVINPAARHVGLTSPRRRLALNGTATVTVCLLGCGPVDAPSAGYDDPEDVAQAVDTLAHVDERCVWPGQPVVLTDDAGTVLWTRVFDSDEVFFRDVLPADSAYLAFRSALAADDALLRRPIADAPRPDSPEAAEVWRREGHNVSLVFDEDLGSVEAISCLDALLFAEQHRRVDQLDNPTEFIANVLRRAEGGREQIAVVFGAGVEMFPPKSVYGFDRVADFQADRWTWSYAVHNHTVQANGSRLALGTPVPSTSDVDLMRGLIERSGLQAIRVTNGVFTFEANAEEAADFIGR